MSEQGECLKCGMGYPIACVWADEYGCLVGYGKNQDAINALQQQLTEAEAYKALADEAFTAIDENGKVRWVAYDDYGGHCVFCGADANGFEATAAHHEGCPKVRYNALTSDLKGDASEGKVSFWARAREVLAQDDKQPE